MRLTLQDDFKAAVLKLAEGNPGAATVLAGAVGHGALIDPEAADPVLTLYQLDDLGVYGAKVWALFKDVAGSNYTRMLAVLRAQQLGHLNKRELWDAIDGRAKLNVDNLLAAVRAELPTFGIGAAA